MCVDCDKNEESGIEILQCEGFNDGEKDRISDGSLYSKFFDDSTSETSWGWAKAHSGWGS